MSLLIKENNLSKRLGSWETEMVRAGNKNEVEAVDKKVFKAVAEFMGKTGGFSKQFNRKINVALHVSFKNQDVRRQLLTQMCERLAPAQANLRGAIQNYLRAKEWNDTPTRVKAMHLLVDEVYLSDDVETFRENKISFVRELASYMGGKHNITVTQRNEILKNLDAYTAEELDNVVEFLKDKVCDDQPYLLNLINDYQGVVANPIEETEAEEEVLEEQEVEEEEVVEEAPRKSWCSFPSFKTLAAAAFVGYMFFGPKICPCTSEHSL
ncbi:MAG: hypothetical protein JSS32_06380 [Verrucomicrobia bacterium]|nr:hypothetical protein [Verrucomicrobiota bacterium]